MNYGGHFDIDNKIQKIEELEKEIISVNFWNDIEKANKIIGEKNSLNEVVSKISNLKNNLLSSKDLLNIEKLEPNNEIHELLEKECIANSNELGELEVLLLLDGKNDIKDCILEVHSGAGGTEACDWANMLYRMYYLWCEKNGYKYEVLDYQSGEETGIKSITVQVIGKYAYGYLKNEIGIHRLVRLSPFDSNNRRHTSFASVNVTPVIEEVDEIVINENDLKIDVYRSSGAGGQHINTTDSAVRITHLPTKIVVTCQAGRSQIQNKEKALQLLKIKLKLLEESKKEEENKKIKSEQKNIEFGSQIRSYVMHPYSMVKDHRTNFETSNVQKTLDGNIDDFINENLKRR